MVSEGHFVLRPRVTPDLVAGDYRIRADHQLSGHDRLTGTIDGNDDGQIDPIAQVQESKIHFDVNSPRYQLPPGEVLSTFPPANAIGSFGTRLPQVVIKRRTLPWERTPADFSPDDPNDAAPFVALVLIAEGEAELKIGVPAADCFTDGVDLPLGDTLDDPEVAVGNCLAIRKSMIDKIFPTQQEVMLLTHSREVDLSDTELALGDDDGYLSVVVSNRLPMAGTGGDGNTMPVNYLACLVNLEGQFEELLEETEDPPLLFTWLMNVLLTNVEDATVSDHVVMGTADPPDRVLEIMNPAVSDAGANFGGPRASLAQGSSTHSVQVTSNVQGTNGGHIGGAGWGASDPEMTSAQIYAEMASGFSRASVADLQVGEIMVDPILRFPVMLHWSFTTSGNDTFESLMDGLDSRLLGDTNPDQSVPDGRLPLEVAETGHTGLTHRTRVGDEVRAWYRGPLAPHPMDNSSQVRLPLAHSSDQLRVVTPDGREDLSLAAAFEVGRLLALSQPSIVASLLRWRQHEFRAARLDAMLESASGVFAEIGTLTKMAESDIMVDDLWGITVGRQLVKELVTNPDGFVGPPRPLLTPGRGLEIDGVPSDVLATGLGLDPKVLRGRPDVVFEQLREAQSATVELDIDKIGTVELREGLQAGLRQVVDEVAMGVLSAGLIYDTTTGNAFGAAGFPALNDGVEIGDYIGSVLSGESVIDLIDPDQFDGDTVGIGVGAGRIDNIGEIRLGQVEGGIGGAGGLTPRGNPSAHDDDSKNLDTEGDS